jgi:hypothetical protein
MSALSDLAIYAFWQYPPLQMTSLPQQSQLVLHFAWTSDCTQQNVPTSWPGQLF